MESSGFTLSPKVYVPAFLAAVAIAVQWFVTGEFDKAETGQAILAAAYALVGTVAPPAPGVRQAEVEHLARKRR